MTTSSNAIACRDYGLRAGCLGEPDWRFSPRGPSGETLQFCAFCGPIRIEENIALGKLLRSNPEVEVPRYVRAVMDAEDRARKVAS